MIFNEPKWAHKTKPSYQDILETAHTEIASLAKRQKRWTKQEQLSRRAVTCKAIRKNNQLTEATRQRLPSVTAELSSGIIKVCAKGWRDTSWESVYFLFKCLFTCLFTLQQGRLLALQSMSIICPLFMAFAVATATQATVLSSWLWQ